MFVWLGVTCTCSLIKLSICVIYLIEHYEDQVVSAGTVQHSPLHFQHTCTLYVLASKFFLFNQKYKLEGLYYALDKHD